MEKLYNVTLKDGRLLTDVPASAIDFNVKKVTDITGAIFDYETAIETGKEQPKSDRPPFVAAVDPVEPRSVAKEYDEQHTKDPDFHARHLTVEEVAYLRKNVLV